MLAESDIVELNQRTLEALLKAENRFKASLPKDEDEDEYDYDEMDSALQDLFKEFTDLLAPLIKSRSLKSSNVNQLPACLRANNTLEFIKVLDSKTYPEMHDYISGDLQWTWAPLAETIREVITTSDLSRISSVDEFDFLLLGYINIDTYNRYMSNDEAQKTLLMIEELLESEFLSDAKRVTLIEVQNYINYIYSDACQSSMRSRRTFEGDTAFLENIFLEWFGEYFTSATLMDDDEFSFTDTSEFETIEESNMDLLKESWIKLSDEIFSRNGQFEWQAQKVAVEVDIEIDETTLPFKIHLISEEHKLVLDESSGATWTSTGKFRITLMRTGRKDEYLLEESESKLALQALVVLDNLRIEPENLICEIAWLRENELEQSLKDFTYSQFDELGTKFLNKLKL